MTSALTLLAASFAVVFLLGLQQLNVQAGHRLAAFGTSILISGSTLVQLKLLPGPTTALDLVAYIAGSAVGVVASMAAHPRLVRAFAALSRMAGRA